jgi:hypothetical protein
VASKISAPQPWRRLDPRANIVRLALTAATFQAACTAGPALERSKVNLSNFIDPKKELLISNLSVIEDPARTLDPCDVGEEPLPPWSFGKIMQIVADQAGAPDASSFVKDWLDTWTVEQVVNGHILSPLPIDQIITTLGWQKAEASDSTWGAPVFVCCRSSIDWIWRRRTAKASSEWSSSAPRSTVYPFAFG